MQKIIFSGIQPSGNLHIGNYIGAIKQWVELQKTTEAIFCIVDLHAITVPQEPQLLHEKIIEVAALYVAAGIDPSRAHIFVQSENPDHAYLAWILTCITPFGGLVRMTQFKDKSMKQKDGTGAGLFSYPVLMASDILLYQTDEVPVGDDQKQHIELTRDIAEKFNKTFGEVFKLPEARIMREAARIMSIANPSSKMSKSDLDPAGTINLLDTPDQIVSKIKRAVTDSNTEIDYDQVKKDIESGAPNGIGNLLTIYASIENKTVNDILLKKEGMRYGEFKAEFAEKLVEFLEPLQKRYRNIRQDDAFLKQILDAGCNYARKKSSQTLTQVRELVGIMR